ncbi:MAG: phosphoglucomutase/phosphomannomutase family protein [Capsulimonadales bacterium]|nr:phosphoglucomutase/phosphomannomutase family protein [Capsulimonadales bacterium]
MIASNKIAFGTDGWRAVMAREFTFDNVALVAQAIADHVVSTGKKDKGVIVGYDARFLSEQFAQLVADVLLANGVPAYLPDRDTPTPVVAYTIKARDLAGAVMLTASHNPPEYNGIKFIPDYLHPALPDITDAITARIAELQADPSQVKYSGGGKHYIINPKADYFAHIAELIDLKAIGAANLTICVDPLYATGRGYLSEILKEAGATVHTLHDERNPLFGGSLPEPNAKNLIPLAAFMKEKNADLGLSMDGDADRFGMLDKTGAYITSNQVIALTVWHWAQTRPRPTAASVVRTVATSGMIDALAKHFGMTVTETPVGFKWVGNAMRTTDAIVGGEESGGLSVRGHIPEKDGIMADLVLTELVAKSGKTPLELLAEIRQIIGEYLTTRVDIRLPDASKRNLMTMLREATPATIAGQGVASVSKIDGVKMVREDGSWLLIRPSGTEPLVRCYIEARSESDVEELRHAIHELIPDGEDASH